MIFVLLNSACDCYYFSISFSSSTLKNETTRNATSKGMEASLKSAVFFILCFTETIAPVCDPDVQIAEGSDPDQWNDDPRWDTDWDYMTYYCVWKSWSSWSGCFRGTKSRYRVKEDDEKRCRCD